MYKAPAKKISLNSKVIEVLLGWMLLLSAGVVFLHLLLPIVVINSLIISIYLFLFFIYLNNRGWIVSPIHPNFVVVVSLFLSFVICTNFLFFIKGSDDRFTFAFFWHLVMLTCFFLDSSIIKGGIRVFANIVFWIALLAIINYVIALVGIDLPNYQFNIPTRDTTYFLYPGTVRLFGQNYSVFGLHGYRLSGIFTEPSMFGIVCALVLYSGVFKSRKFRQATILIGLLLSFSFGAILMSFGLYLFSAGNVKSKVLTVISGLLCVGVIALVLPRQVIDTFFFNKLSGDVIDERVAGDFGSYYKRFLNYGDAKSLLLGNGVEALDNNGFVVSDYRGFFVKYGYLGILLIGVFIFSLISFRGNTSDKLKVAYIFFVIFAHRSWFVIAFIFLFYMYFLSIKNYKYVT